MGCSDTVLFRAHEKKIRGNIDCRLYISSNATLGVVMWRYSGGSRCKVAFKKRAERGTSTTCEDNVSQQNVLKIFTIYNDKLTSVFFTSRV